MPRSEESALVVLVPEAEPLVAETRSRFDRSAIRGMPAHVTVLYPFRDPGELSPALIDDLRGFFAGIPGFGFRLAGLCGFPGVVYLVPDPLAGFDDLCGRTAARFPETPPYGGAIAHPIPHLTVAQKPPADSLAEVSLRLLDSCASALPVACAAAEVSLAIKEAGRWRIGPRFALGSAAKAP